MNTLSKLFAISTMTLASAGASAEIISSQYSVSGKIQADNEHWIYLSTSDSMAGVEISEGHSWQTADEVSYDLSKGEDYYLHILATNVTGPAGIIGQFSLGDGHSFSNGETYTVSGDGMWDVSYNPWRDYAGATILAANGSGPWGGYASAIDANASWIWTADTSDYQSAYYSIAIVAENPLTLSSSIETSVPLPASAALLGVGLLGFSVRRKTTN
jgi:uncharacterized protein involved in tolerance to divalent cations